MKNQKFKLHETVYVKDKSLFNGEKLWINHVDDIYYFGMIDGFKVVFYEWELESINEHNKRLGLN